MLLRLRTSIGLELNSWHWKKCWKTRFLKENELNVIKRRFVIYFLNLYNVAFHLRERALMMSDFRGSKMTLELDIVDLCIQYIISQREFCINGTKPRFQHYVRSNKMFHEWCILFSVYFILLCRPWLFIPFSVENGQFFNWRFSVNCWFKFFLWDWLFHRSKNADISYCLKKQVGNS